MAIAAPIALDGLVPTLTDPRQSPFAIVRVSPLATRNALDALGRQLTHVDFLHTFPNGVWRVFCGEHRILRYSED
jgi:hypothetical protein